MWRQFFIALSMVVGILFLPLVIVRISHHYLESAFMQSAVQGVVFSLAALYGFDVFSKYRSGTTIWKYVSTTMRDKVAFLLSLITFYTCILLLSVAMSLSPFVHRITMIPVAIFFSIWIFAAIASRETRSLILDEILSRRRRKISK